MKTVGRWRVAAGCVALFLFGCASSNPVSGNGGSGGEGGVGGMGPDLIIQAALAPKQDCRGPSEQVLTEGSWDLDAGEDYVVLLTVENTLSSSKNELDAERNTVQVSSFEIALETSEGSPLMLEGIITPFRSSSSIIIPPRDGEVPSVEIGPCLGIPFPYAPPIVDAGLDRIVLQVRAIGTTFGGARVSSAPFEWPVDLCSGCMRIDCPGEPPTCTPGSNERPWCEP